VDNSEQSGELGLKVSPRYTFDAFVTGTSNRFAHAAAMSVAETPARSYNPLFIYGDAGLGKTHLLQAISNYVRENYVTYQVRYVSTEQFLNQYVEAIRQNTLSEFKKRYREIDVLLLDDIQFIEGKEGLQEELFHTFESLYQANKQIVLSSDRPPDAISTLEDRLRSRFKMGLTTEINPPELETRLAILRKKAEGEPITPSPEVLEFSASNITSNIRELEGALIRVCAYASLTSQVLDVALAEFVLDDLISDTQPRPLTPDLILEKTSEMFGFPIDEIRGQSRRRPLVTARQVGMYVMRELTDLSYPAIAREFGGRDHTTVIHAVEKIGGLMKERRQIYDQVTELAQRIRSGE
jgi:chromosomal replication initiator protein